jgi:hypothetical protein
MIVIQTTVVIQKCAHQWTVALRVKLWIPGCAGMTPHVRDAVNQLNRIIAARR